MGGSLKSCVALSFTPQALVRYLKKKGINGSVMGDELIHDVYTGYAVPVADKYSEVMVCHQYGH